MSKDTVFAVRIPKELKDAISAAAEADMRSPGNLVTKIITDYLRTAGYLAAGNLPKARKRKGG